MELTPLRMCPIFQTSNVTGEGLDYVGASSSSHLYIFYKILQLRTFLNLLPSSERDTSKFAVDQPLEVSCTLVEKNSDFETHKISIIETWSVPYVGTVVNGVINAGIIKAGETVLLGPDANGNYRATAVKGMQRKR